MAQVTLVSDENPVTETNPLLLEWQKLMAQMAANPEPPPPAQLDKLLAEQGANVRSSGLSASQVPVVQQPLGQGMTRGLSPDQFGGPSETGLTYSGGVAGYGGPAREADKQLDGFQSGVATNQGQYDAIQDEQRARLMQGPGGMRVGDLMDRLGPLLKLPAGVREPMLRQSGLPGTQGVLSDNEAKLQASLAGIEGRNEARAEREARINMMATRLPPLDRRELENTRQAYSLSGRLKDAHAKLFSDKSTKLSDTFKQMIAASGKANTIEQAFINDQDEKLNERERAFAAEYNNIVSNLYSMTQERQLSEPDAIRNLRSFNPNVSPAQFAANVKSRMQSFENRFNDKVEGLRQQQYEPKGFENIKKAPPPPSIGQVPEGKIAVTRKSDGKPGFMSPGSFDPEKYEKVGQ